MTDRIATTETRLEGFYWVILGQNPPEIAYWERGEWWLAGANVALSVVACLVAVWLGFVLAASINALKWI